MTETTNLKLKKPDYDDIADIKDINDNMDLVDEICEKLNQQVGWDECFMNQLKLV